MTSRTYFCTADEVRRLLGVDSTAASDANVEALIAIAEAEVEAYVHTKFLVVQSNGTATAGATTSLTDSSATWTADEWNADANLVGGYMVYIYSGTGSGQCRVITDNTTTQLTVSPAWSTNPSTDSLYRIFFNSYTNETFSGDDTKIRFTDEYPVFNLQSVTIDSTSVTTTTLYNTSSWGKLQLGSSSEKTYWDAQYPLLCNIKYYYGVYPLPQIVKDFCIHLAAVFVGQYMIGSTYTVATSYSIPDLSITKGVPYPHFDRALSAITKNRDWLQTKVVNQFMRSMFG